jgi:hypothetical protein
MHMSGTVVVQARISEAEAGMVQADALQLGLEGTSEAVREGLALLHRRAQLSVLGQSYDDFYGGVMDAMTTLARWGRAGQAEPCRRRLPAVCH